MSHRSSSKPLIITDLELLQLRTILDRTARVSASALEEQLHHALALLRRARLPSAPAETLSALDDLADG